ncbi:hypothetical protein LCGC14_2671780, partial [marine sediment metagenome]
VAIAITRGLAQAHPVDDAGVVEFVRDHRVLRAEQGLEQAAIGVETRRIEDGVPGAEEPGQFFLQRLVDGLGAADEADRRHTVPPVLQSLLRRGLDQRMLGQAKIVVGAHVQDGLARAHADMGALGRGDDTLFLVQAVIANGLELPPQMLFEFAVHAYTASEMTGISMDWIKQEDKIIGKLTDRDLILELRNKHLPDLLDLDYNFLPQSMSIRQMGKKGNHGLNYMEGYWRFALENEIPEAEAKIYVNGYTDTYINLPLYWEAVERKLGKYNRTLENCFGHKRRFLGEWGSKLLKQAVAFNPQSTSVWVVNYAMRDIYNDDTDPFKDLCIHAQVHDELLLSYPIGKWREAAEVILGCENYMSPLLSYEGREFRIGTDLSIGINWGERSKENPSGMGKLPILTNAEHLAGLLEESYAKIIK